MLTRLITLNTLIILNTLINYCLGPLISLKVHLATAWLIFIISPGSDPI